MIVTSLKFVPFILPLLWASLELPKSGIIGVCSCFWNVEGKKNKSLARREDIPLLQQHPSVFLEKLIGIMGGIKNKIKLNSVVLWLSRCYLMSQDMSQ